MGVAKLLKNAIDAEEYIMVGNDPAHFDQQIGVNLVENYLDIPD